MEFSVVCLVSRFVAKQVSVGTCLKISLIACPVLFADGQGDGTVRMICLDAADQAAQPVIRKILILASLEYKGPKAQLIACPAACQYFLRRQSIPGSLPVITPDTAVIAVVSTEIGKLNQTADKDLLTIDGFPDGYSPLTQVFTLVALQQILKLVPCYILFCFNIVNNRNIIIS